MQIFLNELTCIDFLLPACEVHFDNTPVPVENVLEKEGAGFQVKSVYIYAANSETAVCQVSFRKPNLQN